MESLFDKVFDGFKKATPALVAIMVFTGLILFLPVPVLEKMSLNNLPDMWKIVIGASFLLSIALLVSLFCFSIYKSLACSIRKLRFLHEKIKLTRKLSPEQKSILANMLNHPDKYVILDSNSGNTIYLLNNAFIYQPQQFASLNADDEIILRYTPQAWVMDLYQNRPRFRKLLDPKSK